MADAKTTTPTCVIDLEILEEVITARNLRIVWLD